MVWCCATSLPGRACFWSPEPWRESLLRAHCSLGPAPCPVMTESPLALVLNRTHRSCMAWVTSHLAGAEPHPGPAVGHSSSQHLLCPGLSSPVGQARQEGMVLGSAGANPLSYDSSCLTALWMLQPCGWAQSWARRRCSGGTGSTSKFLPNRQDVLAPHGEVRKSWIFRRKHTVVTCWSALEPCAPGALSTLLWPRNLSWIFRTQTGLCPGGRVWGGAWAMEPWSGGLC